MKNTDAQPPYETLEIGTPLDYTSDMYRVYFEVGDKKAFKTILLGFLGPERQNHIMALDYGYEVEIPIQCIPEISRLIVANNIGLYQVIRIAKTANTWC